MASKSFKLNTGYDIPALGLGTWQSPPGEVKAAVLHALKSGYRHIDCAYMYGNKTEVGEAFKEAFSAGIMNREDLFVTTKLWCTFHSRVEEALSKSLEMLGLDYVDLYLVHWAAPMNPNGNHPTIPKLPDGSRDLQKEWTHTMTWDLMCKLPATGKAHSIGVCNYSVRFLEQLLSTNPPIIPAVNQIENHPYLPQQEIADFCKGKGIHITAYSPFGSTGSPLMQENAVQELAKKKDVSSGCVLLSYPIAKGMSVIPKSVTPSRIEENMKVVDLSVSEVAQLQGIHKAKGVTRYVYPSFGIDFGFPDKSEVTAKA